MKFTHTFGKNLPLTYQFGFGFVLLALRQLA